MKITRENYFSELSNIGIELEKKGKFSYGSWADVWHELKKHVPDAGQEWIENEHGTLGLVDDFGCFAKVRVKSESLGVDVIQYLHCMDYSNRAIKRDNLTASEINKTYQRCTVKAIATGFGLGLYVYRGEDLPSEDDGNSLPSVNEKEVLTKHQFKEIAKQMNEAGLETAKLFISESIMPEFTIPSYINQKIKELSDVYKENQNVSDEDIDRIWKQFKQ